MKEGESEIILVFGLKKKSQKRSPHDIQHAQKIQQQWYQAQRFDFRGSAEHAGRTDRKPR